MTNKTVNATIEGLKTVAPGCGIITAVGLLAFWLHTLPFIGIFSGLIISIVLGILIRNTVRVSPLFQPGINFGLKRLLRIAVALLGLQLSVSQIKQVGVSGFLVVCATLVATFVFTTWIGRLMKVDQKLTQLIAAGTSICGASAIIGVNVVTNGSDEDVAYSVGTVTVFGTLSMLLYPLLVIPLHLAPNLFGLWAGSSIHEVAQVVAAAFQDGKVSGQIGTISKLSRVMLLAPVILGLGLAASRTTGGNKLDFRQVTIPWFVLGFVMLVGVSSTGLVPAEWKHEIATIDQLLLAVSMAAMGLETHLNKVRAMGIRPFALGAAAWIFVSVFSLVLIRAVCR